MPSEENRGVDSMGSDATLKDVGLIRARLQNGKVHKPNSLSNSLSDELETLFSAW